LGEYDISLQVDSQPKIVGIAESQVRSEIWPFHFLVVSLCLIQALIAWLILPITHINVFLINV